MCPTFVPERSEHAVAAPPVGASGAVIRAWPICADPSRAGGPPPAPPAARPLGARGRGSRFPSLRPRRSGPSGRERGITRAARAAFEWDDAAGHAVLVDFTRRSPAKSHRPLGIHHGTGCFSLETSAALWLSVPRPISRITPRPLAACGGICPLDLRPAHAVCVSSGILTLGFPKTALPHRMPGRC